LYAGLHLSFPRLPCGAFLRWRVRAAQHDNWTGGGAMKFKVLLAAALALAVAAPALADQAKDAAGPEAPKEKKICRTETVTGSLISKRRICMTKAEWDELAQRSKSGIDKYTSRSSGIPGSMSNPASPQ
jgi:hypothetical protein